LIIQRRPAAVILTANGAEAVATLHGTPVIKA
jgi:hypothetical protein